MCHVVPCGLPGFTLLGQLCGIPEVGGRVLPAWLHMTVLGGLCGFVGSLLDSLVGAIWQVGEAGRRRLCLPSCTQTHEAFARGSKQAWHHVQNLTKYFFPCCRLDHHRLAGTAPSASASSRALPGPRWSPALSSGCVDGMC